MSRGYVRDTVRQMITSSGMVIPFHESINYEVVPNENMWFTIEFNAENTQVDTYCRDRTETGVIDFVFGVLPGQGDHDLIAAADSDIQKFMKSIDPNGKLVLLNDMAPEEFTGGDANQYYQVVIGVEYSYTFK